MISPQEFLNILRENGFGLFCGVPDSLLKNLCACIDETIDRRLHIITANEGNALALASGYYLASGKTGCVYLQNSGLGNLINPLTSLSDAEVYQIPVLLIVGWRGEPGEKDEPQHIKQGKITKSQLELLDIPYYIVDSDCNIQSVLSAANKELKERNSPVALLVKSGTFIEYVLKESPQTGTLKREEALSVLLGLTKPKDIIIAATGKTSREIFEIRNMLGQAQTDFLTVGAMGHNLSIALGAAIAQPSRRVICIDGDGSMLMHMGSLAIAGNSKNSNLVYIVLNNAAHESVGGQPTVAGDMDLSKISEGCGYSGYFQAVDVETIKKYWAEIEQTAGPVLFEIKITTGSRPDLGRPSGTPKENKQKFMKHAAYGTE
ncbi:phosphonopyruvate decarboxylase [Daejeonella lutea]|uniref:Phosphonopyruvate decarboxylase n=1 Tax=Daejeonella lutea TaxID=572036 RepID=A0A1T5DYD0_9SPHI|nr:phosphonopyruvate decarboxylase [Daejeonella lutea]SKB76691.1 phosphonopyruvate decarboxylase [Daejeonella lutea]